MAGTYNNQIIHACPKCMTQRCDKINHTLVQFDSKGEFERFKRLSKSKQISKLVLKPVFSLYAYEPYLFRGGRKFIGKMTPDYTYYDKSIKKNVIEDYKGGAKPTPEFVIRWKILQANQPNMEFRITNEKDDFL